jgi:uncharacterized protein YneF (UPF0154 family)
MTMALFASLVIGVAIVIAALGFLLIGRRDTARQIERRLQANAPMQESIEKSASAQ